MTFRCLVPRRRARTAAVAFAAVVCLLALPPSAGATGRLGDAAAPTAEHVRLKLDPNRPDYSGSVRVELRIPKPTRTIRFHAEEMTLDRVVLTGGEEPGQRVPLATEVGERGLVTATAPAEIAPGGYALEIDFTNQYETRTVGLYRMEQEGKGYLFTQFEATDARRAFPCWDEPQFKIPFHLTLEVPSGQTAVTNAPVASSSEADGWRTDVFAPMPPTSSYLVAIAVGPLDRAEIPGLSVPGYIYTPAGQAGLTGLAAEVTPPILVALERYFGRPYPYAKLDFIAVPEFWPGGMENPGAITYADNVLLVDPKAATPAQRANFTRIIAHELAHMWFGDLVTMKWWDDLWLNESFADWMGYKISGELYPQFDLDLSALRETQDIMAGDARPTSPAIHKPVDNDADAMEGLFIAYAKGRAVLAMVEEWVGPEAFRQGVLAYLDEHAWGNATGDDLWAALSKASGADVTGALRSFVDQPGLPLIDVAVGPDGAVTLRQKRLVNVGVDAPAQSWRVPVVLKYRGAGGVQTRRLLLTGAEQKLALGSGTGWVMPNAGALGYYRWRVPSPMLIELAEGSADLFTPRERIAFLGNAAALLAAGAIGGDDYLKVLNAFARDPEPEVLSGLLDGLGHVEAAFVPDDLRDAFAVYVRKTLAPALERFGRSQRDGEPESVSPFRARLVGWLGDVGQDPDVQRYAADLARAYRADPASVDPSLIGVALNLSAANGDRALFDAYRRGFEQSKVPADRGRYLNALGHFEDPALRADALDYALNGPVRPNELFTIPGGQADTEKGADDLFTWAMAHYDEIASRIPPDFVAFFPFFASGCSAERLERARAFHADPAHRVDGTEKQLAKVADQVNDCVNLRRREGAKVAEYLRHLADGN